MYAITRRLDVLAPVRIDCEYGGGRNRREREEYIMETAPTIDTAVGFFDAHTVELYPDVRDRVAHTVIDIRSGDGSTVRFYNAMEEEFMKARTDRVSKLYRPLFDEKPMGVRHAENGRLYAIIENTDNDADEENKTREVPVGAHPFAEMVMATRPYTDGEADGLL